MTTLSLRAVALIRMSTHAQLHSPERQRALFQEYCARWSLAPVGEYADEGVSATHTPMARRHGLQKLLADAEKRRFEVVWVEEVSRLARRGWEFGLVRDSLVLRGIAVVTLQDNPRVAVDDMDREFRQDLDAILARREARQIGARVQRDQRVRLAAGGYRGGPLPLGLAWDREQRCYVTDPDWQPVAEMIFHAYLATGSCQAVARALHAAGHVTTRGGPWSGHTVVRVLRNPAYRGRLSFGTEEIAAPLPTIVPSALVASVDLLLAQRSQRSQRSTDHRTTALFAGLLRCPGCGGWLHSRNCPPGPSRRGRQTYVRYLCTRARQAPVTCTWRRVISQLSLERAILPTIADELRRRLAEAPPPPPSRRVPTHARQLAQLDAERERVIALHVRGTIGVEKCETLLAQVAARREALAAEVTVSEVAVTPRELRAALRMVRERWPAWPPPRRRELLQALLEHIVPNPDSLSASHLAWRV